MDADARCRTKFAGKAMGLRAGMENVGDRNVWLESGNDDLTVSTPRTFVLSPTFDFRRVEGERRGVSGLVSPYSVAHWRP
ncbi:MAG: hypothetical protein ACRYGA_05420 [Janthinobacterium lividum]